MTKKIVIFDLDGTLLNTLTDLANSTNYVLDYFNFPAVTELQVRNYVGNGVYKLIERAIPEGKNNPKFEECVKLFKQNYKDNMYNNIQIYDGVKDLLSILKQNSIKTAVASNKFDNAVKELCSKLFSNLIDFAVGENEISGIKKKPSSDMIIKILEYFSLTPKECLYIGDSEVDIETAQNSNIDCLSVSWGFKSEEFLKNNGAKNIVNNPLEILNFLD